MIKSIITKSLNLSRWRDFLNFTLPVTLLGYAMGIRLSGTKVSLPNLLLITAANVTAIAFAFIINELEDAEDDGKKIDVRLATWLSVFTFAVSLLLYSLLGKETFVIGLSVLILSFLYSWKKVRLKAYPVVDVVSHCLMLGGLLFLSSFYVQGKVLGPAVLLFSAITLTSAYGQFYNQVRDFEADKRARLRNTSILIGKKYASILMYSCIGGMIILVLYSFYTGLLPIWFIPSGAIILFLTLLLYKANIKERDRKSGVPIVNVQAQFYIMLTILSLLYLFLI